MVKNYVFLIVTFLLAASLCDPDGSQQKRKNVKSGTLGRQVIHQTVMVQNMLRHGDLSDSEKKRWLDNLLIFRKMCDDIFLKTSK